MSVKIRRKISERSAGVFDNQRGNAWIFFLAFRNDHGCAFFDGLADEFVAVGFFAAKSHKQAIPLHSPRVIRDAFHWAIKCPDDLANWNRGDESFELHEGSTFRGKAFNDVKHWLSALALPVQPCELVPPEWPCESPHAAQDRDSGQPFRRPGKRSGPRQARRSSAPVCSFAHRRVPRDRQTRGAPPADNRRKRRRTFPVHNRLWDQLSARSRSCQRW